jgi:lipopolysaccharide export system permease protein
MFLYEKNILKNLFFPFIIITFTIVGIAWIVQSIRYLELILSQGARILDFLNLTLCLLPLLIFIIIPVSLALTVYYVYNKLLIDREIIILYSLGVTRINIIKPFLYFSIIVTIIHLLISYYLIPISSQKFKNLKFDINQNSISNLIQFNTFISKVNNLTIYIEKKEGNNLLKNIMINDSKNPNKEITYIANSGRFYSNNNTYKMILYNGIKLEFQNIKDNYIMVKFSEFIIDLNQHEKPNNKLIDDSYELNFIELLKSNNIPKNKIQKFRTQGHFRIIWPVTSLSIIIILYFITLKEESRIQNYKINFYAFFSFLIIIGFNLSFYIFSQISYKYHTLVYLFNLLLPLIFLYRLYKSSPSKKYIKYI